MMELLVPLGLLGLLGIVALIIIYIIKPNYLVKHISSTYVWQLSLKYKRKRLPTSMWRNILIFLCQLFALALCAGVLSMPVIAHEQETDETDVIAIIESSASMYTGVPGDTRWTRAIDQVQDLAEQVTDDGGFISVIIADSAPYYLAERANRQKQGELMDDLEEIRTACSYGTSDIEGAIAKCDEVLVSHPSASIKLYTGISYYHIPDGIEVISVAEKDEEWNAAILNAEAELEDAYYSVTVDIASYGQDNELEVRMEISGMNAVDANDEGTYDEVSLVVFCEKDTVKTVVFCSGGGEDDDNTIYYDLGSKRFYSYHDIHVTVSPLSDMDYFLEDNSFNVYGGQKEVLKVQYASSLSTTFMIGVLHTLQTAFRESGRWDFQYTDVPEGSEPATAGYDFYIFEHTMPEDLPTDGVVLLLDPDKGPAGSGIRVNGANSLRMPMSLTAETPHEVMDRINADSITVTRYTSLQLDSTYEVLMSCDARPVFAIQKSGSFQVAVLGFSVHYSNIIKLQDFFLLFYNLFEYYLPATVKSNAFEVGEKIEMRLRGTELSISPGSDPSTKETFVETEVASYPADIPGSYTIEQRSYFNKDIPAQNVFVRIPRVESNIYREEDELPDPYSHEEMGRRDDDLLIYLMAAIVALLFAEWVLHMLEVR